VFRERATSFGEMVPGIRSRGSGDKPGLGRGERLFLGLAAAAIALWGWSGVDWDVMRDPGPPAEAPGGVNASVPGDSQARVRAAAPSSADGSGRGGQLFESSGCAACHATGPGSIGPSLRGAWGTSQALADGTSVLFDRAYFEESVLHPEARLVRGYKPAMPSYEGLLSESDLDALAEYIRTLK
jgi:mono/diheme cytochrome c family protein